MILFPSLLHISYYRKSWQLIYLVHQIKSKSLLGALEVLPGKIQTLEIKERREMSSAMGNNLIDILSNSFTSSFNDLSNLLNSSPVAKKYAVGSIIVVSILLLVLVLICSICIYFKKSKKYQLIARIPPIPPRVPIESHNLWNDFI